MDVRFWSFSTSFQVVGEAEIAITGQSSSLMSTSQVLASWCCPWTQQWTTAVGGEHCNLLDGPGLASLHRIASAGLVAGNLSGPPCETWSAARNLQPPPDLQERWPRPLRSAQRACGLAYLTQRELQQLATGSALMLSNLKIEITVVLNGGASLLEHPDIPECPEYASVWRTPIQSRLCQAAPGHQRLHIQQWKYGAKAIKPTLIRAMGLPASAAVLHGQALPDVVKPVQQLSGRDEMTGQFRTACAKEYPEGLCKALVITLFKGLARRRHVEGLPPCPCSESGTKNGWPWSLNYLRPILSATSYLTTNLSGKFRKCMTARATIPSSCRMKKNAKFFGRALFNDYSEDCPQKSGPKSGPKSQLIFRWSSGKLT